MYTRNPSYSGASSADPQSSKTPTASTSQMPTSSSRYYQPYFSHAEIEFLSEKQRGKQSATQEEKIRQSACTFLETIGARIGFPRRTIATAQAIYHRFHLFFPRKDFQYHDAALAALYVSTKENDTLKKPRELLATAYTIRFPELAAKSKNPVGDIDLDSMDPQVVENDRQKLLAVERLMLETICFNFAARMPFSYVIKNGKRMQASKKCIKFAWRIAIDSFRTLLPLIYPPHILAVGCIYVAALLLSYEQPDVSPYQDEDGNWTDKSIAFKLSSQSYDWQHEYQTKVSDCEDIAHTMLDLFIQFTQSQSTNTSPSTPSSPSPNLPAREKHILHSSQQQQLPFKADQLIQMKITLREREADNNPVRKRKPLKDSDQSMLHSSDKIGQNEGTVRFLFFPPGAIKEKPATS